MITDKMKEYQQTERPRESQRVHQPVVICVDTSSSMNLISEDGKTSKIQIVEDMLNELAKFDIKEVDICILAFDDDVRTLVDWRSISDFHGGLNLDSGGCTSLGSAVLESIKKTRERRRTYRETDIISKRAQIFIYTDGASTEDLSAAYQRSQEYLNRENPSVKMYGILIPPAVDPRDLAGFGKKVAILAAKDCVNGIPETFKFMTDSIVEWSESSFGDTVTQVLGPNTGIVAGHGGATVSPDGTKAITEVIEYTDGITF